MQLKYFSSFMNFDISTSRFWNIRVIVFQSEFDTYEINILLFNIRNACEKFLTAIKKTLAALCIVIEDIVIILLRSVAYIYW